MDASPSLTLDIDLQISEESDHRSNCFGVYFFRRFVLIVLVHNEVVEKFQMGDYICTFNYIFEPKSSQFFAILII